MAKQFGIPGVKGTWEIREGGVGVVVKEGGTDDNSFRGGGSPVGITDLIPLEVRVPPVLHASGQETLLDVCGRHCPSFSLGLQGRRERRRGKSIPGVYSNLTPLAEHYLFPHD